MTTAFCDLLGIDLPIAQAAIGGVTTPALAAAVSNSGGLGTVNLTGHDAESARDKIQKTRELTSKPFCVNFLLPYEGYYEDALEVSLSEKVPVINLFWGDPAPFVERVHAVGSLLMMQIGSVNEALHAAECGVDIVIAQGWEAGGHVRGEVATLPLVSSVVDELGSLPVLAAGGISDGRGLAAVLCLGAAGAWIGTRFLASEEASTATEYLEKVLKAQAEDTVYTTIFDRTWPGAPHRVLRNSTYRAWDEAGQPPHGRRPGENDMLATHSSSGYEVKRYESYTASAELDGDIEALALWAGQGVGLVNQIQPAADIVREIAEDAQKALRESVNRMDTYQTNA
ncbi:MAG: nitronate monooxygenase [Arenicellales bacterium]|nr:nitronate monooxygenase [Arenicellales bacterium]